MKKHIVGALAVGAMLLAFTPNSTAAGMHPEIHAALESLRGARAHLMEAKHDFHGHRAEALKHVDAAIHEAEICMAE